MGGLCRQQRLWGPFPSHEGGVHTHIDAQVFKAYSVYTVTMLKISVLPKLSVMSIVCL